MHSCISAHPPSPPHTCPEGIFSQGEEILLGVQERAERELDCLWHHALRKRME